VSFLHFVRSCQVSYPPDVSAFLQRVRLATGYYVLGDSVVIIRFGPVLH
jgi:hypothetical protein